MDFSPLDLTPARNLIYERYPSLTAFANSINIPLRTIESYLSRGSGNILLHKALADHLNVPLDALINQSSQLISQDNEPDSYFHCTRSIRAFEQNPEDTESLIQATKFFAQITLDLFESPLEVIFDAAKSGMLGKFLSLYSEILQISPGLQGFFTEILSRSFADFKEEGNRDILHSISTYFQDYGFMNETVIVRLPKAQSHT